MIIFIVVNKFICLQCTINHPNNDKHNTFNFKRYDSLCKNHSNNYSSYCQKCKKNLCAYCLSEHESHDIINLSKLNYSKENKKKLEEEIKSIEKKIKDLDIIKENVISEIDNLQKSSELEMKFFKILIYAFQYEESQNNLN